MRFWSKYFLCYSPLWPLLLHWRIFYSWLLSSIASLFLFFMLSFFGISRSNARNLKALIQLESRLLSVEKSPCTWLLKVFDIFSSSKKKKAIFLSEDVFLVSSHSSSSVLSFDSSLLWVSTLFCVIRAIKRDISSLWGNKCLFSSKNPIVISSTRVSHDKNPLRDLRGHTKSCSNRHDFE